MTWNSPIQLPLYGKYVILGFVAWVAILGFIQDGLKQVRRAQEEAAAAGTAVPGAAGQTV